MNQLKSKFLLFFILLFVAYLLAGCTQAPQAHTEFVFGTVCSINLFKQGSDERYQALFMRLRELDAILSANRDDSTIAKINAAAGITPVYAEKEILDILGPALEFAEKSGGRFNPAIGPLVRLWNIGNEGATVPKKSEITNALKIIDWRSIHIDHDLNTVFLEKVGMRLDLGAIAKGYAANEAAKMIHNWGLQRGIIDLGGNILVIGSKEPGKPWHIGIRNPEISGGNSIVSLHVSNISVVTSGVNERFFIEGDKQYHHILDPKTGYPAENELLSVSVLSADSMVADALSTTLFLLGTKKSMSFLAEFPGVDAIFIDKAHAVRVTKGLQGSIQILDPSFHQNY
ncbi:MAG TPA: FAD:protein FMN transferase [Treponema sp.]|nr:FAD:protein FMN transferase [Treponema sp.]